MFYGQTYHIFLMFLQFRTAPVDALVYREFHDAVTQHRKTLATCRPDFVCGSEYIYVCIRIYIHTHTYQNLILSKSLNPDDFNRTILIETHTFSLAYQ